jgi:hypothetical protein
MVVKSNSSNSHNKIKSGPFCFTAKMLLMENYPMSCGSPLLFLGSSDRSSFVVGINGNSEGAAKCREQFETWNQCYCQIRLMIKLMNFIPIKPVNLGQRYNLEMATQFQYGYNHALERLPGVLCAGGNLQFQFGDH